MRILYAAARTEAIESQAAHQEALRELQQANEASKKLKASRDNYEELLKQSRLALDSERIAANEFVAAAVKKAGDTAANAVARAVEAETKLKGAEVRAVAAENKKKREWHSKSMRLLAYDASSLCLGDPKHNKPVCCHRSY